jgi:hypothetical protein
MTRATCISLAVVASLSAPAHAQTTIGAPYKEAQAFVYSMTGLFGQTGGFSTGVFKVTRDAVKEYPWLRGYLRAHYEWRSVAATAKANYLATGKPIILIGHSLGADSVWRVSHALKAAGIPVAAAFSYDQTRFSAPCVPSNVIAAIGFTRGYIDAFGGGTPRLCDPRVINGIKLQKTDLENHVIPGGHTYIDDAPDVHAATRKHIGEVTHMIVEMGGAQ